MDIQSDEDSELEFRVSEVADEVALFVWSDLAERLPLSRTYVRPENDGPYMAVTWEANWKGKSGGPILIRINGYLDRENLNPVWGTGVIITRRQQWFAQLRDRFRG